MMDFAGQHPPSSTPGLPTRLSSFIGREREIAALVHLLADARLVTLVGAPGVGKTRLSLEVADGLLASVANGVWLVELAALAEPALVPHAVAATLRIQEQPPQPLTATLGEYLRERELLLILDNCEHLIESCATLAEQLLRAAPGVRILATSREALRAEGEMTWRVPSLSTPDTDTATDVTQYEATRLFLDRAAASAPAFRLTDQNAAAVAQVCRRLDGIPLAIELAAARVSALPPDQLAARLDDHFELLRGGRRTALPRQQTLRAAIAWSYDLLSEDERTLLRRLSVFSGGWTLKAAERVASGRWAAGSVHESGADPPSTPGRPLATDVLDLLVSLVDQSLVQVEAGDGPEARYRLLEMIRQFGSEHLAASGEETAIRCRHLEWFGDLAERGQAELQGGEAVTWMKRLVADDDNFRAAMAWSLAAPGRISLQAGLRIAAARAPYRWLQSGQLVETWRWLERILAADAERRRAGARPDVRLSTSAVGAEFSEPTESLHEAADRPRVMALCRLGHYRLQAEGVGHAGAPFEEALALARGAGDRLGEATALVGLANVERARDDYARSVSLAEESLSIFRSLDDRHGIWWASHSLGDTLGLLGDFERAGALLRESLAVARSMGFIWGIAQALRLLGVIAYHAGDLPTARALLEESLDWWTRVESTIGPHTALWELGHILLALDDARGAAARFTESLSFCHREGIRRGVHRCLQGLAAATAAIGGEPGSWEIWVGRLIGLAASVRDTTGDQPQLGRAVVARAAAAARERLGEETFAAVCAEGRVMPVSRAIDFGRELAGQLRTIPVHQGTGAHSSGHRSADIGAPLSARESEVAALVAHGLSNRQIATTLVISERTVQGHVASILSRLDFRNRAQIAAWAMQRRLTTQPEG